MQWVAAYGKTATCCLFASDDELKASPERFVCETCELRTRREDLWIANAEAWRVYTTVLCGKAVGRFELQSQALDWVTAGWSVTERLALLTRLDWILDVLDPESNGRAPDQESKQPEQPE